MSAAALWAAVPTIDFSAFTPGAIDAPSQLAVARQMDAVARVHGFCKLSNVGIAQADVDAAFSASKALFALPAEHKMSRLMQTDRQAGNNRHYFAPHSETLNAERANDLKEAYNVRKTEMDWRGAPEGFQAHAEGFYAQATGLAQRVLTAMSLALGLPPDYLSARHRTLDLCTLRFLHYMPVQDAAAPGDVDLPGGRVRAGEHTDFGSITLVFIDSQGGPGAGRGLQVRRPGDAASCWLDVDAEPGTVVVNTGGLLAQWTNDEWRATPHRVVVTPEALTLPRYSIALFFDPDSEVLVECLPAFCSPERPAKYAPITSREYLLAKLAKAQQSGAAGSGVTQAGARQAHPAAVQA